MVQMKSSEIRHMLNKVPEVTIYFWIIKGPVHDGRRDCGRLSE